MVVSGREPLVKFLTLDRSYEAQIRRILNDANADLERQILRDAGRGLNPISQLQAQNARAAIQAQLGQSWDDMAKSISQGRTASALLAGQTATAQQSALLSTILDGEALQAMSASEAARSAQGLENVLARLTSSYKPLSERVYNNKALTAGRVDRIINSNLARGNSARQLAGEVRQFISPNAPGGVSYSAMRLARTEFNNAFHASTVDRYQENETVSRVDWNLSGSHKHIDICDVLAARSYDPSRVPEKPHPQCFCFITPQLLAPDDFMAKLMAGGYDDKPWYDGVVGKWAVRAGAGAAVNVGINYSVSRLLLGEVEKSVERLLVREEAQKVKVAITAVRRYEEADTAKDILHGAANVQHIAKEFGATEQGLGIAAPVGPRALPLPTAQYTDEVQTSVRKLKSGYADGYRVIGVAEDASSTVQFVELKDGTKAVVKAADGAYLEEEALRETLSYRLLKAIGVDRPNPVFADGAKTVSRFVDNALLGNEYMVTRVTGSALDRAVEAAIMDARNVGEQAQQVAAIAGLTNARELGLFDWLVANEDRHGANWFVKDGRVIAIDNGGAFDHRIDPFGKIAYDLQFPNEFSQYAFQFDEANRITGSSVWTPVELRRVREQIRRTLPDFARAGHEDWLNNVLSSMDDLIDAVETAAAKAAARSRTIPVERSAAQRALETGSAARFRNDIADLQDSLDTGYERLKGGINSGINETYKIRFGDGTLGIEKNIPLNEINQEIGSMRVLRGVFGVDEMPAIIVRKEAERVAYAVDDEILRFQGGFNPRVVHQPDGFYTFYDGLSQKHIYDLDYDELRSLVAADMRRYGQDPFEEVVISASDKMIMRYATTSNGMNGGDWLAQYAYNRGLLVRDVKNAKEVGLFDFIAQNTDRHGGNWLFDDASNTMIPIDHGFTFGNGYWTGAPANYQLERSWLVDLLDVPDVGASGKALMPDVLDQRFRGEGFFPGPGMQVSLPELLEYKRKLAMQEGYFNSIGKPYWYKTMEYNLNDLIERKRIYEANNLRSIDDIRAWQTAKYREQHAVTMGQEAYEKARTEYMRIVIEAEFRGMDVEEFMAKGQLGTLPSLSRAEVADLADYIADGGRYGERNALIAAEEMLDNEAALAAKIKQRVDFAKQAQMVAPINNLNIVPKERLSEWAQAQGVDQGFADDFMQGMLDNVTPDTALGYDRASLYQRLEDFQDQMRELLDLPTDFDLRNLNQRAAGAIPHVETTAALPGLTNGQIRALDEYGTFIGWNNELRGIQRAPVPIVDFEKKTQAIDQAIHNAQLSQATSMVHVEGDAGAFERWSQIVKDGGYTDRGFISAVDSQGKTMQEVVEGLENFYVGGSEHPYVVVNYALSRGDRALDMKGVGFDAYIEGEYLLPRDVDWELQGYEVLKGTRGEKVLYVTMAPRFGG